MKQLIALIPEQFKARLVWLIFLAYANK